MPQRPSALRLDALLALLGTIATIAAALAAAVALLPGDDAAHAIDHAHEPLLVHLLLEWPLVAVSALLALAVLARGGAALLRHLRARRRIAPALAAAVPGELAGVPVRVIDDRRPLAFCAGLWRPRVHVSSGAVAALGGGALAADRGAFGADRGAFGADRGAFGADRGADSAIRGADGANPALRALIAHEAAHARRRDGLRQLTGELAAQSLFFLPALRPLGARRATLAELRADAAAVEACGGDAAPLARALLAFAAAGDGPLAVDPARIDALAGIDAAAGAGAGGAGAGGAGAGGADAGGADAGGADAADAGAAAGADAGGAGAGGAGAGAGGAGAGGADAGGADAGGADAGGADAADAGAAAGADAGGAGAGGAGAGAGGAGAGGAGGGVAAQRGRWTPLGTALAMTLALLGLLLALPVVAFEHTSGHLLHVAAFGTELCPAPLLALPLLLAAVITLAKSARR